MANGRITKSTLAAIPLAMFKFVAIAAFAASVIATAPASAVVVPVEINSTFFDLSFKADQLFDANHILTGYHLTSVVGGYINDIYANPITTGISLSNYASGDQILDLEGNPNLNGFGIEFTNSHGDIQADKVFTYSNPSMPRFTTFYFNSISSPSGHAGDGGGLYLSTTIGSVPEPASWVLMVAGFGLVGIMYRRHGAAHAAIV